MGRAISDTLRPTKDVPRVPFLEGILDRSPEQLAASFIGEPSIDDPRHGRVEGRDAFGRYVAAMRDWLTSETTGVVQDVRVTREAGRFVEEAAVGLPGE